VSNPTTLLVEYSQPLVDGAGAVLGIFPPSNYSHEIAAMGGFRSAQISFGGTRAELEEWFANGVGRHIRVMDGIDLVWEGFVNQVSIQTGVLTAARGPLLAIGNKVKVAYQTVTYNTNPPIGGDAALTNNAEDTASQGRYGIVEKVLNGGSMNATEADQVRDTYLSEYKDPETTQQINTQAASANSVTLECLGYISWLDAFYYTETANSGTRQIKQKIEDVLGAEPNSFISTDYNRIDANSATVGRYEQDQQTGWAVIRDLVARGDSSGNRHLFGVYGDRIAQYGAIPTNVLYEYRLGDKSRKISVLGSNQDVPYWKVRPGQWMRLPDFLIGRVGDDTPVGRDPRNIFIESVTYQIPWSVQINGGKTGKLAQLLAQKGLGGM